MITLEITIEKVISLIPFSNRILRNELYNLLQRCELTDDRHTLWNKFDEILQRHIPIVKEHWQIGIKQIINLHD